MDSVFSFVTLAARPEYRVEAVVCREDHTRWSAPEARGGHRLVLVRRGTFRRRAVGQAADFGRSVGYLGLPDEEENFAHPHGGDECTAISLSPSLWSSMAGEAPRVARRTLYVDARVDLAHRRILTSAQTGDADYAVVEELLGLLGEAVGQAVAGPNTPVASASRARDERALVDAARAAIEQDDPAAIGLLPLAELLGVSPFRLSRAFPRELGVSLTHYRNRVRVGRVLDRLEQGERNLSLLAADLGYADQAHLCRTVRRHVGHTPTALRKLLASPEFH